MLLTYISISLFRDKYLEVVKLEKDKDTFQSHEKGNLDCTDHSGTCLGSIRPVVNLGFKSGADSFCSWGVT